MPGIIKYKLDITIKNLLKRIKNEMSVVAEYIPESADSYTTKCKVIESHKTLFEVNISCATQEQAKFVAENWQKNAVKLYPKFIELLTQEPTEKETYESFQKQEK